LRGNFFVEAEFHFFGLLVVLVNVFSNVTARLFECALFARAFLLWRFSMLDLIGTMFVRQVGLHKFLFRVTAMAVFSAVCLLVLFNTRHTGTQM
jgi:hypothetical protein